MDASTWPPVPGVPPVAVPPPRPPIPRVPPRPPVPGLPPRPPVPGIPPVPVPPPRPPVPGVPASPPLPSAIPPDPVPPEEPPTATSVPASKLPPDPRRPPLPPMLPPLPAPPLPIPEAPAVDEMPPLPRPPVLPESGPPSGWNFGPSWHPNPIKSNPTTPKHRASLITPPLWHADRKEARNVAKVVMRVYRRRVKRVARSQSNSRRDRYLAKILLNGIRWPVSSTSQGRDESHIDTFTLPPAAAATPRSRSRVAS